jgi:hypothetical protein
MILQDAMNSFKTQRVAWSAKLRAPVEIASIGVSSFLLFFSCAETKLSASPLNFPNALGCVLRRVMRVPQSGCYGLMPQELLNSSNVNQSVDFGLRCRICPIE